VLGELVPLGARDALERVFERVVVELVDAAAPVAHEVVMVRAARLRRFEAGAPVTEVDAMDESQLVQLLEDSVDARDSDGAAVGAEPVEQLLGRETAVLLGEVTEDGVARATRSRSGAAQLAARVLLPGR
jgi:hypothetical protein